MKNAVLEVKNLTKSFGDFKAVDDISFSVEAGEILGLLGPNGAGKTTTIQMLLGLTEPTSGTISYFGKSFETDKVYCLSHINYASADSHINGRLSVWENFNIFAGLYNIPNAKARIMEVLELLETVHLKDTLFWHLSSGQKTRVMVAKALLNKPRLLLMDEPTAFLDVEIAAKVTELILNLQRQENVSIIYTSHRMEEVEKLCDRIIFLNHGKIVITDTPDGLARRSKKATLILIFEGLSKKVEVFLKAQKLQYHFPRKNRVEIKLSEEKIPAVLFSMGKKVQILEIDIEKPNLEDAFLDVINEKTL